MQKKSSLFSFFLKKTISIFFFVWYSKSTIEDKVIFLNICTIGTSWITDSFIQSASYADGVAISAVCSRSAEKAEAFASTHGVNRFYDSVPAMLRDDEIDAVYIASPNVCHFEQAKACLLAGKHVICEKPAVVTTAQLTELFEIAEKKGLVFLEAMKSMHSDGLPILRKAVSELGEIRTASVDFSQLSSKYPAYKRGENPNIFNPAFCTGALMDLGVYCVYFAYELFGEPESVISHADFLESGADYAGTLLFLYRDKTVTITYSKVANGFSYSRILGENGAVGVRSVSKLIDIRRYDNDGNIETLYPDVDENLVMSKEIEAFRDFAQGKNPEKYKACKAASLAVCRILEEIRTKNRFGF